MRAFTASKYLLATLLLALLYQAPVLADRSGVIVRDASVHEKPGIGSRAVGELEAGTRVTIFSRRGGWKEIFADDAALVGWVRAYQVREGDYAPVIETETESDERGFLSGLASFSRKASRFFSSDRSSTSDGTATIGVRGLSEAQLKSAQPDFDEFAKMKKFASTPERLTRFQRDGRLQKHKVKHLQQQQRPAAEQSEREK